MSKLNVYTTGLNGEYTIFMVKNMCPEFETLTDAQALRVCELLAQVEDTQLSDASDSVTELENQVTELEDELDAMESSRDYYKEKYEELQEKLDSLKGN